MERLELLNFQILKDSEKKLEEEMEWTKENSIYIYIYIHLAQYFVLFCTETTFFTDSS